MNILLLSTHLNIGGIARYTVNLAKNLKRRGHKVVVSSSGGDMIEELVKEEISHIELDIKTKSELNPKLLYALPRLLSLVRSEDIQIIHAHTRVTQLLAYVISRLSHIPYVTTCHGFFKPRMGRRLLKCWGDKTIAISDAVRDHLMNDFNVDASAIALIYNGIDIKRFKKELDKEKRDSLRRALDLKDGMVIGAIGRLSPVKGYKYLIEAIKILLDEYRNLRLLVVGDGPEKEKLKDLCKRLDIEESVTFAAPRLNTPEFFSIIDIFVASSVQEGLGLSIVESLAAGKPVVATDVGGISSIVRNNETGLLVKSEDGKKLAKGISLLLKDSGLRDRLGAAGRKLVERDFTIDDMVDKVERVYKEVL